MGNLIKLDDYKYPWKEAFALDGPNSTLQVYVNERTGEAEIVQMNDDGEAIRTPLSTEDFYQLSEVTTRFRVIANKKGTNK